MVVDFHNPTQEKKFPKYVQRQIEKEAPSRFVQQFFIEVPIYLRIGWLCEIVKWATNSMFILNQFRLSSWLELFANMIIMIKIEAYFN